LLFVSWSWISSKFNSLTHDLLGGLIPEIVLLKGLLESKNLTGLVVLLLSVDDGTTAFAQTTFLGAESWSFSWFSLTEALLGPVWIWVVANHWSDALL
jgi:hypothetical protein